MQFVDIITKLNVKQCISVCEVEIELQFIAVSQATFIEGDVPKCV